MTHRPGGDSGKRRVVATIRIELVPIRRWIHCVPVNRRRIIGGTVALGAAALGGRYLLHEKRKLAGAYDFASLREPDGVAAWVKSMAELDADPLAAAGSVVHVGQSTH